MAKFIEFVRANVREGLESLFLDRQTQTISDAVRIAMRLYPFVGLGHLLIGIAVAFGILLALVFWVRRDR